ncbi:MAG TPA: gamma-glutamyl-gamma-aminobutyrate hydrolase family protein [Actinocrinis sp.]|uniref:gamma-glutamyl-gamma-aminobutyrate hydrolase family protein n=1 Tax=Actinocrinis sp. TaxID=1920516 RepID=UPI002DDDA4E6|nr:gamma-glutamyl-gamma-aminobutyrate hydrolase family protein [Actinocrinis sp.]HEV3172540.1 gamma-glutamyl-gamma-aminobutyrate hydrolase family protein [Actinocrinis sp.]
MSAPDEQSRDNRRPLIGISAYREVAAWGVWRQDAAVLPYAYVEQVARAGGVPLLIPPVDSPDLAGVAAACVAPLHALLLAGGPDIDPQHYAAQRQLATVEVRPQRDAWELALLDAALDRDIPVLGICRGAQLLNIARGGTLHQHLPEEIGHESHRPAPAEFGPVEITLERDALPGSLLGGRISVPCYHHQAIHELGRGLAVTARALDGTVEAVELAGRAFVVGVQWHPEQDTDRRLFDALIAAARVGVTEEECV